MASASDLRSILSLPAASTSSQPASKHRPQPQVKKPDGISRELFALIGDNAPSLAAAAEVGIKFKDRPKVRRKAAKWEWREFTPSSRTGFELGHWVRAMDGQQTHEDPFAKYNTTTPVLDFSQSEYDSHLRDDDWTQAETTYLFSLLRTYDLRFVIAADRYDFEGGPKRSIEDIKSRYYSVCRRLVRTRPTGDEAGKMSMLQHYAFDRDREIARKNYASSLFHLTPEQIAEEEALYVECKRMEQQEKTFRADREDLMKMLAGFESGLLPIPGKPGEQLDKKRKDVLGLEGSGSIMSNKRAEKTAKQDLLHCIHRLPLPIMPTPGHKSAGSSHSTSLPNLPVYLRSTRMPQPSKPALLQPIVSLLATLRPPVPLPGKLIMPTRVSLERLDGLILASQGLLEMKRQVDRVELEVKTLKARLEARQAAGSGGNTPVAETMSGGGQSATSAPPAPATTTAATSDQVPVAATMAASDSSPAVTPAVTAAGADVSMVEPPAATASAAVTPGASESAFEEGVDKDGRPFKRPRTDSIASSAMEP